MTVSSRLAGLLLAFLALGAAEGAQGAEAALIRGKVVDLDDQGVKDAAIEVLRPVGGTVCATRSGPGGLFGMTCAAAGPHTIRAAIARDRPQTARAVSLQPGETIELDFVLVPASEDVPRTSESLPPLGDLVPWIKAWASSPLPNPTLLHYEGHAISLRLCGIATAVGAFLLVLVGIRVVGAIVGVTKTRSTRRRLGDMLVDDGSPASRRLHAERAYGRTTVEWTVQYGPEEIAPMLEAGRYGSVFVTLLSPALVGVAVLGFLVAVLVGQPIYVFGGTSLIAAAFMLTPVIMLVQARRLVRKRALPARRGQGHAGLPAR